MASICRHRLCRHLGTAQDGAFGEHRLERMQSFLQFQDLVAHAVDQWCRQANVGEVRVDIARLILW